MPRLVEFFLTHATGPNVKLHWEQGDSTWEPHKQCVASLVFQLTPATQDIFAKWRLTAILSLLMREKNVEQLLMEIEEQNITDPSATFSHVQVCSLCSLFLSLFLFLTPHSLTPHSLRFIQMKSSMNLVWKILLSSKN